MRGVSADNRQAAAGGPSGAGAAGPILPSGGAAPGEPALLTRIEREIAGAGGWLPFDRFMALALYAPGLGYYANAGAKFGALPSSGSDFVTAPEMTPLFAQALAVQLAQALRSTGTDEVWEFGAGSGALAAQLLDALDAAAAAPRRYVIVELSASLRARQQQALARHGERVRWCEALPPAIAGVVIGNEVLDAMPVQLLQRRAGQWLERGVAWAGGAPVFAERPTPLRPPIEVPGDHDYQTEIAPQAQAFVRTVGERLQRGAAFFIDYGFPEHEYYHPQRHMGTLACHRAHRVDGDPLSDVGQKDITAHVDFTAMAVAAQDAGLQVLGYASQGRFLLNCGLAALLEQATLPERIAGQRLLHEHEMGELFKVLALGRGPAWAPLGFAHGDRTHRL